MGGSGHERKGSTAIDGDSVLSGKQCGREFPKSRRGFVPNYGIRIQTLRVYIDPFFLDIIFYKKLYTRVCEREEMFSYDYSEVKQVIK